jgi:hypothetical protein
MALRKTNKVLRALQGVDDSDLDPVKRNRISFEG